MSKDGYTMGDGERMLLGAEPSTYYLTCNTTAEPFNNCLLYTSKGATTHNGLVEHRISHAILLMR